MGMIFFKLLILSVFVSASPGWAGKFHLFMKSSSGREVHVYLPREYHYTTDSYPVLYVQDGQNFFDPKRAYNAQTWNGLNTLNELIDLRLIQPLIVVTIDNTPQRINEYTHDYDIYIAAGGGASDYIKLIQQDIMPVVKKHLRVKTGREATGLLGSSLGGLLSLYGGVRASKDFGLIASLSPSLWWNQESIFPILSAGPVPDRLYLDSGTVGGERPQDVLKLYKAMKDQLPPGHLKVVIKEGDSHNERAWSRRLSGALIHLFGSKNQFRD
jgi:predicted alpha/beta superfamily hydrolase